MIIFLIALIIKNESNTNLYRGATKTLEQVAQTHHLLLPDRELAPHFHCSPKQLRAGTPTSLAASRPEDPRFEGLLRLACDAHHTF